MSIGSRILTFLIIAIFIVLPVDKILADKNESIYIEPNFDEDLQISGKSYINYDVKGKEGQSIDSSFIITNSTDEPMKIDVVVKNGLTDEGGEVYDHQNKSKLSGFLDEDYLMNRYIKDFPELIELGPNEEKEVSFVIEVPKNLKGRTIGGLGFIKQNPEKEEQDEGISIELKTGFLFSIWLKGEKEDTVPMEITDLEVETETKSPILYPRLENNNSDFLKDGYVDYEVIKKKDDSVVFSGDQELNVISPKNYFNLPIHWDGELEYGKYQLNINGQTFDFEITKDDVDKIAKKNDPSLSINDSSLPLWAWILIGILILALIILFILFMVNRNKAKTNKIDEE